MTKFLVDIGDKLKASADKMKITMDDMHRFIVLKTFTNVVLDTPVDFGTLVGGWKASEGEIDESVPVRIDPGRSSVIREISSRSGKDVSKVSYLTNSVPYVLLLEFGTASYGFSPKAPAGMIRVNIDRIPQQLTDFIESRK